MERYGGYPMETAVALDWGGGGDVPRTGQRHIDVKITRPGWGCGITIKLYHVDVPRNLRVGDTVNSSTLLGTTTATLDPRSTGVHLHMEVSVPGGWLSTELEGLCFLWGQDETFGKGLEYKCWNQLGLG